MPSWFVLVLTVVFELTVVESKSIPDYLHVCHRSDPKIGECITNSVNSLRDKLITGIPDLGVPSIEPLLIEEPISTQGAGISVTTKDLKAFGGGNFTIKHLDVDAENLHYIFTVGFSHLLIEGNYFIDGKIIMIPIKGDGDLVCDVYDVECKIAMDGKIENANGQSELRLTALTADVAVGSGKIHLGNLFGGDKLIGEVINSAINLNFQYFIKELKPIIQDTLATFILKTANTICDGLKYDDLVPA